MTRDRALRATALAALAAGAFLLLAAADLALRSRQALLRAEQEEAWSRDPAAKAAYYDALLRDDAGGRRETLLRDRRDYLVSESSAKMACLWYRTAAEDFYFPGNPWAAEARARLPAALAAWNAELAAKGVKAPPWMTQ